MTDNFAYPVLTGYMSGCNLGHCLSQYGSKDEEHWNSYIVESDFARIASWGMDHVRLPVDYMLFETDEKPGEYREDRLAYIDTAIACACKYGLNVVLDLHRTAGFSFNAGDRNDIFSDPQKQARFIAIWEMFARRYASMDDCIRFDLLNEMVWENSDPWNALWPKAVAAIHRISPERKVIVGGNVCNSVNEIKNLTYMDDPRIIYGFHLYYPFLFTHQGVGGDARHAAYKEPVTYPFNFDDHPGYFDYYGDMPPMHMGKGLLIGREYLEKTFIPAIEFIRKHNRPLYMGEYGVVHRADDDSAVRWYNDMADICLRYGIGRAVWSYRGFSKITDENNQVYDQRMVEAVARQK